MDTSKEFKIKIINDIKLNIDSIKLNKLYLKIKGKNNKKEIFNANVTILLTVKSNKVVVEDTIISKLELDNSSDELSYNKYRNIYNHSFESLLSSSSSSSSNEQELKNIYKQISIFVENIKFYNENNKVNAIYFTLKNSNIKKMKLRGKLN